MIAFLSHYYKDKLNLKKLSIKIVMSTREEERKMNLIEYTDRNLIWRKQEIKY